MRPLRTIIVLPADPERLPAGGIASFVRGFVKFAPDDFKISFVGVSSGDAPKRAGQWTSVLLEGREVAFMPVARRATMDRGRIPLALSFTAALVRHRPRFGGDPCVFQFHKPATALPLLGIPHPKVRVVHLTTGQLTSSASESRWRMAARVLGGVERASFQRMDRIYVVNADAAESYRVHYPTLAERISFVPNWFDDTIFRPVADSERAALRLRIMGQAPMPKAIILSAARLESQKDPMLMLEAFGQYREREPSSVLLVAGTGGMRRSLEARARSLGIADSVRFMGVVERKELAQMMNAAHAMLITSAHETGPTVAYESLACGLPIVATAVGQIPRLLTDRAMGQAIAGRSPRKLADAIATILARDPATVRRACADAARPFAAGTVLGPLYRDHRALVDRRSGQAASIEG